MSRSVDAELVVSEVLKRAYDHNEPMLTPEGRARAAQYVAELLGLTGSSPAIPLEGSDNSEEYVIEPQDPDDPGGFTRAVSDEIVARRNSIEVEGVN